MAKGLHSLDFEPGARNGRIDHDVGGGVLRGQAFDPSRQFNPFTGLLDSPAELADDAQGCPRALSANHRPGFGKE